MMSNGSDPERGPAPRRSTRLPPPPPLSADCALFLDIDGTLVGDAPTPDAVRIDEELVRVLPRIAAGLDNALALITGRSISGVDSLFPQLHLPMAGQHGTEHRDADGNIHLNAPDPASFAELAKLLEALADRHPGLHLEDKGNTLAVHYRDAPQLAAHVHRVVRATLHQVGDLYALQPGKRMLEVRPRGRNKGTAIAEFMREPPFAGRRPVFAGDDVADEFGFAVVDGMGGWSVKVGRGRTGARYRLPDIPAVMQWLVTSVLAASLGSP